MKTTPLEHEHLTDDGIEVYEYYWQRYGQIHPTILNRAKGILLDNYMIAYPAAVREYKALKFLIDTFENIRKRHEQERYYISKGIPRYLWQTISEAKGCEILTECGAESNET